jgi:hypothetical protein
MKTVKRTLIYTGPESWVQMCIERAFVKLQRQLGEGKSITSSWGEVEEWDGVEEVKNEGGSDGNSH